jgi:hypothetical protein
LLINEFHEGIHIFDNSDPSNPTALSFLPIPGNVDMAIRNDRLYADNYVDLLTFDIRDPQNPQLVSRMEEVFFHYGFQPERGYIIAYEETEVTQEVSCRDNWDQIMWFENFVFATAEVDFSADIRNASTPGNSTVGTGGSLARFTIAKDYMYTVSEWDLKIFDLENADEPAFLQAMHVGWGIETIFPRGDELYIGSRTGMFIVDITEPARPEMRGTFWHSNACDPVVVDGDIAYITLRDGTECETFTNQLDVVNISDLDNPYLIATFPMHHPIGLSIYEGYLYLCDDDQGLKVFDASNPKTVGDELITTRDDFTAIDVITLPREQIALVIGIDGLYQFDITQPDNPVFLSHISIAN